MYYEVPAAYVYGNRAYESHHVSDVKLGQFDRNNGLYDMWKDVNGGADMMVTYNTHPGNPNVVSGSTSGHYDIVRLEDGSQREQFLGGVAKDEMNYEGEKYTVDFRTRLKQQEWRH
jgi:hypothetical protein